jgi:dolichol-phosphate mannosyltransferase
MTATFDRLPELTVLVPAWNEAANLAWVIPRLQDVLNHIGVAYEILVVDAGSTDGTAETARRLGARVYAQRERGFGRALAEGFACARGSFIVTMDADVSHDPWFLRDLWEARERADIVIASRYVEGGQSGSGWTRHVLSRILNETYRRVLALAIHDLSSNFRLYRREVVEACRIHGRDFEALEEILVRAINEGYRVAEVPFHYRPRAGGASKARILRFGWRLARMLLHLWRLRNSAESADYDYRAFDSRMPLQRWWQRRRYRIVMEAAARGAHVLDIGAGSSRIALGLPQCVAVDLAIGKCRFLARRNRWVVRADARRLPIRSSSVPVVVCSNLIEHVRETDAVGDELRRVAAPGALLVLATPDCFRISWRVLEEAYMRLQPHGHLKDHVARFTLATARRFVRRHGFVPLRAQYVYGSELILVARASDSPAGSD